MFNPSRDEVRQFFRQTWDKHLHNQILSPLEAIAFDWIGEHPEYHEDLHLEPGAPEKDYGPNEGKTNPFLHLSMHLSITEQVSIDQPTGIRAAVNGLAQRMGSMHAAHHEVMECLGEMLWRSQREGRPPDAESYIDCVRRRAKS